MSKENIFRFLVMFIGSQIMIYGFPNANPLLIYYFGALLGGVCWIVWPAE